MTVTRPALRYHGGKWLAAPWILSHMPAHRCYVELFGGGGALLLRKAPSPIEVYNDADGQVVNFFRVLRERPGELVEALRLTPYARAELHLSYEDSDDPLEAARRTFVRLWQGHGGSRASWRTGWRYQRNDNLRNITAWNDNDRLLAVAERLKAVQIECGDAVDVVRRFDTATTLFYADPPYVADTRSKRWRHNAYGAHEFDEEAHRALAERLSGIKGMAMVSGYASPLYDELYAGWTVVTKTMAIDGHPQRSGDTKQPRRVESLYLSPRAAAAARQALLL